jgi:signal transduction histidine kinase/ActR/RegA family two-component response regulator
VEIALRTVGRLGADAQGPLLGAVERQLAQSGETRLLARALACQASRPGATDAVVRARAFSRAVALLGLEGALGPDDVGPVPQEHAAAARRLATALRAPPPTVAADVTALNALAHRALLAAGFSEAPDDRVASALRRVLEATGRMNAGAGLDDLLQAMTRHTVEITGAERACVVLVESEREGRMRLATSATSAEAAVDLEELSGTVIQRVLASREPLLLHDVFDDEELLGRPSITSLSLRSILCVPMVRGDLLYGVMYADSASAAGSFDRVDLEVLSLFAEQAAASLETHRLVADLQNSMVELRSMQERLIKGERLRTMGELSSGVAHEFNNLLTAILARVQLIGLNPVGQELKHDLSMIERACLDAAEVVRRLQAYTRNQRQQSFQPVDLGDVCRDAVEFLRPLWSTRRRHDRAPIQVHVETASTLPVLGDATELREVVTNLVKNALDALASGGRIEVLARRQDGRMCLDVVDDGPGMPPEVLAHAFDPFFTTKGERGTGLGLCLCQQIVERHGGEIRVDSRPGTGTRVSITLPEAAPAKVGTSAQAPPRPAARILVVDDDENVREPLCAWLERAGYAADGAPDAEEALRRARDGSYDLVISDVGLPGMSGIELCRRLTSARPGSRVILMSGWAETLDPSGAARAGALDLLPKPFALQQVSEMIGAALGEPAPRPGSSE